MSSGAKNRPPRSKTLVGMRAPDLPGLPQPPSEPPGPPGQAEPPEQAAADAPRERTVADVGQTNTAGAGAWANALLSARVRSEPRSPTVPDIAVDDLGDHTFTSSAPPEGRRADDTARNFNTAGHGTAGTQAAVPRKNTPALHPPGAEDDGANPIGHFIDSAVGSGPAPEAGPVNLDDPEQARSSTANDEQADTIRSLIDTSLDDGPVSEVGPVAVQDTPGRTSSHPQAAPLAADAPWGLDNEEPSALPPLGAAVNSLSMTRGDDSVSIATLEGSDAEAEAKVAQTQRSTPPRLLAMVGLIGLGVAAGATGLWLWQGNASAPKPSHETGQRPAATVAVPAEREAPPQPQPAPVPRPEPTAADEAAVAAPAPNPGALAQEPAEKQAPDEPAEPAEPAAPIAPIAPIAAIEQPQAVPTPAGSSLEQARALVDQAVYLRRNGREREAIANYEQALKLHRGYGRAMAGLARVYIAAQNGERALYWAKRLNRNQPPGPHNQLLLGDAQQLAGNAEAAAAAWTKAVSLGSVPAEGRLAP